MEHGTVEMYRKELREQKKTGRPSTCIACTKAQAAAIAKHREERPPRDRSAETRAATVRRRALSRLAEKFPEEFERLLVQERTRASA